MRSDVKNFAEKMDRIMLENKHKPGYEHEGLGWLIARLEEELLELKEAYCQKVNLSNTLENDCHRTFSVMKESVDIANFCMMIYMNARKLI